MGGINKSNNNNKSGKKTNIVSVKNLNWKHTDPKNYLNTFNNLFREPDILSKDKNGIAIWYPKMSESLKLYGKSFKNVFSEHWLRDESIEHMCPKKHTDFFL